MKKHSIALFGVPTLFTVLIVVLIISFSTLSYLNTLNVRHSIERGNSILEDTYTLQSEMELSIIELEKNLNTDGFVMEDTHSWTYDRVSQLFTRSKKYANLNLDVTVKVVQNEMIELDVIAWKLTSGNNQDYTQDGDPVYGG